MNMTVVTSVAILPAIRVLLLCLLIPIPGLVAYELYKDASQTVEARVQDLMKRMTLAEKIGQMLQIERTVGTDDRVHKYMVGGLLSRGGSNPVPNDVYSWQEMVDGFQKQAMSTRLAIPMIYGADAVHGHNFMVGATIFPHNIGLGATRDRDLVKRIGSATALEIRATGLQFAFAPCIANCRDPRWGRCYESYGEDTNLIRNMTDIILGLQGEPKIESAGAPFLQDNTKVAACAKHYVGDGGRTDGISANNTVIDYEGLVNIHMAPYIDAMKIYRRFAM